MQENYPSIISGYYSLGLIYIYILQFQLVYKYVLSFYDLGEKLDSTNITRSLDKKHWESEDLKSIN